MLWGLLEVKFMFIMMLHVAKWMMRWSEIKKLKYVKKQNMILFHNKESNKQYIGGYVLSIDYFLVEGPVNQNG